MNLNESLKAPRAVFQFECRDADGNFKWKEAAHNLVTDDGFTFLLNVMFASMGIPTWFVGLLNGTPAASDTLVSHAGWTEVGYTNSRVSAPFSTISSGSSISVTGELTFNATVTFNGAFLTNRASGSGAGGHLYNATNFSATRTVASGDTLNYTITLSVS